MFFSNLRTRCGTFLVMLLAMTFSMFAQNDGYVYYDNSSTNWETPHVHYWGGSSSSSWPGTAMKIYKDNVWLLRIPANTSGILFNAGDGDNTKSKNFSFVNKHVYTKSGGDQGFYSGHVDPDPGETVKYTIHFHNNVGWDNIQVKITGVSPAITGTMSSFLNSSIFDYDFEAPENASLYCQFYTLAGSEQQNLTSQFKVVDGHVYTISGDKGDVSEYDPTTAIREAEFWIEPENPTQLQEATLYFNRAFVNGSQLKDTDDIYLYIGLIKKGDDDKTWSHTSPYEWENATEKYKMTRVDPDGDLYSFSFTPSIAEWFGADSDERFSKIALIFRNQKGTIKQHGKTDQFITLRQIADPAAGLGAYISHETIEGKVCVTAERGTIEITPMSPDVIKIFTLKNGAANKEERPSISVIDDYLEKPSFSTSLGSDELLINVEEGVKIHVDLATCQIAFHDSDNNLYLRELSGLVNSTGKVQVSFDQMDDEAFYGGGYNGNLVNWDGNTMTMNNNQDGNWGQGSSTSTTRNICVPFYVSTRGYGVYFDDHYRNARIYPSRTGSSYESGSMDPIAYYFIGGGIMEGGRGSMETVMQNYTRLTGLQELPPFWSLGYITSKFSFATRDEAEKAISQTKDIDIPVDGIVFDIHWQTDNRLRGAGTEGMGRIDWSDAYPNPVEMMKNFRDQNVHTIAITEPYFTTNSGNYDYLLNSGYLADDHVNNMEWLNSTHVGLLDITNNGATEWFKDLYKKRTIEGIESWWLDLGEPERHDSDSHYSDGSSVDQINNEYGNRWTEIAFEAMKEQTPDTRFILMPRAGTSGMQRFNTFPWTGDIARSWAGLKAQVPALVSAAMSGISYLGSDIGGFSSTGTDADLYRRWVQLGVFYPAMRTHSQDRPEVWRDEYASVRDDVRDAINLRYAYLPYTYSQSYAYTRFGTPIARPANFADIDNPEKLADCIDAYLWGPDVYVAPVLDNGTSKSITFPEGEWLDMNDFKTVYTSHQSVNYSAPTNVLPHFMRRGSFVTRYRQDKFTNTAEIETDKLTVDYFPTKSSTPDGSIFFDDDHKSVNTIEEGKYVVTRFSGKGADNSLLLYIDREGNGWEGMYETQDVLLRIHAVDMTGVNLDNIGFYDQHTQKRNAPMREASETPWSYSKIEKATSLDDVQNATRTTNAYYVDPASRTAYVRLPRLNPLETYNVELGEPGILTGIETPAALEAMTLAYGNGYFTYSAPQGTEDLTIGVFSVTGTQVALFSGLNADGYAGQIETDLPSGIYIARLTGRNSAGETRDKTIKMIVK